MGPGLRRLNRTTLLIEMPDPLEQLTPLAVIREMEDLTGQLDAKTQAYRFAERDMVTKRHAADIAEAKAYLRADGPVEERKRKALLATELEEGQAVVAEALVRVLKKEIAALEIRIDSVRSKGTTVRAELRALDYQGAP